MGIYADVTKDVAEAFDTDLADAVQAITVIDVGLPTYDPVTGINISTETSYTTRGVVTSLTEDDVNDEALVTNGVTILILDAEKSVPAFKTGMKILIGSGSQTYKLITVDPDAANVSHRLLCGRWS